MNTDKEWECFGAKDPYYGVVSFQEFRTSNMTDESRRRFFHTGQRHVANLFAVICRNTCPGFSPKRTLDFGCGVGRVTIPLARRSETVLGVDVSGSMLTEAKKNARQFCISNVSFIQSDDALTGVKGTFDFVHSFIVFQHIPVGRGMQIIDGLLKKISPGGIGAIHVTYELEMSSINKKIYGIVKSSKILSSLASGVRGEGFASPIMQLNRYNMSDVIECCYFNGCSTMHMEHTNHRGALGWFLFFRRGANLASHTF